MEERDTTIEAGLMQVAVLRRLGSARRLSLAMDLSDEARAVSVAGILRRHPNYGERTARHALFRKMLGDDLYRAAWPKQPFLDP